MKFSIMAVLFLAMSTLIQPLARADDTLLPEAPVGDDGMHKPEWFLQSFLDLGEDLSEAAEAGKGLVVIFEQNGCPYCRELHQVNLRDREIVDYIRDRFEIVQLDLYGAREVTDFDGQTMEERDLAKRWNVIFTPTVLFFSKQTDLSGDRRGSELSAMTVPGYFKPFHFVSMFEYVADGHYRDAHFQNFLNARADRLRAQGKDVSIWE